MKKTDQILLDEIRAIKQRLDDLDMNLEKDREGIQDLTIRLENVETEIKATRQAVNRSSETIREKVAEVVEPAITSNDELKEEVKKNKMVFVTEKRTWWQKFLGK